MREEYGLYGANALHSLKSILEMQKHNSKKKKERRKGV